MNIDRNVTIKHLDFLLNKALILSYDPTNLNVETAKKVEISPSGFEHYLWALNENDYLFMMIEVSFITDREFFEYLKSNYYNWENKSSISIDFLNYLLDQDSTYCLFPEHPAYQGQKTITQRLLARIRIFQRWISDGEFNRKLGRRRATK